MIGVLLSGGIDSACVACWKKPSIAFTIDYGQKCAEAEVRAASEICAVFGIRHEIISADCSHLGSGDLAGKAAIDIAPVPEWWPYRNQLIVTLASMRAIALGVKVLLIGSVAQDSIHADGRNDFVLQMDRLVSMQEGNIRIEAPAIGLSTVELVKLSGITIAELGWTTSCHLSNHACGLCRGCIKHRLVMEELGHGFSTLEKPHAQKA